MIINQVEEKLFGGTGTDSVNTDLLEERAYQDQQNWRDIDLSSEETGLISLTDDQKIEFCSDGHYESSDITEYAFSQLCSKTGIPAGYIRKCFKNGKTDLALENFNEWSESPAEENHTGYKFRIHNGVIRGVLTDRYNLFSNASVLHALNRAFPRGASKYVPNQAFLSPDRLHIRYVDFDNPITVGGDSLHPGFTVNSSDIGKSSLNIKYFLYRFACKNGMVISRYGGTMFRVTHLANFDEMGADIFLDAIEGIQRMSDEVIRPKIEISMQKILDTEAIENLLSQAQRDLHIGKECAGQVVDLMTNVYDDTRYGFINAVTESAQRFTLEKRLEIEQWAGAQLLSA